MRYGYERKQQGIIELNLESWRRTRIEVFIGASPHMKDKTVSMYDLWPLPGDPTPQEREAARQAEVKAFQDIMQKKLNELVEKGYLQQQVTVQA